MGKWCQESRLGMNKMKLKDKIGVLLFFIIITAVFVAAENGVFDNTNYHEYSIFNITNVNATNGYFTGQLTSTEIDAPSDWTNLQNYPVACPVGSYVTQIDDTITCTELTLFSRTTTATDYNISTSDIYVGVTDTSSTRTLTLPFASDFGENLLYINDESGAAGTNNIIINSSKDGEFNDSAYTGYLTLSSYETQPYGLYFKPDGLTFYVVGRAGDDINEFTLATAWDITSNVNFISATSISRLADVMAIFISPDGTQLYIADSTTDVILQYSMSVPWDSSTITYTGNYSVSAIDNKPFGIDFKSDGKEMYMSGDQYMKIYRFNLTTAWDVSTATLLQSTSISTKNPNCRDLTVNSDGTIVYVAEYGDGLIIKYALAGPWDFNSAVTYLDETTDTSAGDVSMAGMYMNFDDKKIFRVGDVRDRVYEYTFKGLSDSLEGSSSKNISSNYGSVTLVSDGSSEWFTVN